MSVQPQSHAEIMQYVKMGPGVINANAAMDGKEGTAMKVMLFLTLSLILQQNKMN